MSGWNDTDGYASEREWIAARIRAARGFRDLTQPKLANLLGVERRKIAAWEDAEGFPTRAPKDGDLVAIVSLLRLRADWFELPLGQLEAMEAADIEAMRETLRGADMPTGRSHKSVLAALKLGKNKRERE